MFYRFKAFINEAAETSTLTIFDIDATLFHTTAKVSVMKGGKVVQTLDTQQFNTYKLKPGESFDFGEFKSAEIFYRESTPIDRTINLLKSALMRLKGKSRIILLTAREDMDDRDLFLTKFKEHGIDIDRIHVERSGNLKHVSGTAEKKLTVIRKYMDRFHFDRINMYDDDEANLKSLVSLHKEYPNVYFNAFMVGPKGNIKSYK